MSSHDDKQHVPAPSLWPIGFAIGVVCLLVGFVVSWWGVAIGAALAVVFGFLWVYDLTRDMREPAHAPVPGTATVEVADEPAPAHAEEIPTYSRSVFLELGDARPRRRHRRSGHAAGARLRRAARVRAPQARRTSTSGRSRTSPRASSSCRRSSRIPSQGEVTRRTAFIRNNGLVAVDGKQEPSFTIIYSRCAHLGCPVQPGGVLDEEHAKNLKTKPATRSPC